MPENCAGDRTVSDPLSLQEMLMKFVEQPSPVYAYQVFQTLKFRDGVMEYTDYLLATCGIETSIRKHSLSRLER